jgi:hypothetical protein
MPLLYLAIIITLSPASSGASVDEEPLCPHNTAPLWGWAYLWYHYPNAHSYGKKRLTETVAAHIMYE